MTPRPQTPAPPGRPAPEPSRARAKWNARYAGDSMTPYPPSPADWLVEHRSLLETLPAGGRALDVACGDGRNARYLAELGFAVDAIDISDVVVERLAAAAVAMDLRVSPRAADLEGELGLPAGEYVVIINFNYLQRSIFDQLAEALRPGGLLIFETFARPHVDELGHDFPTDFLLGDNELLRAFGGLHVRHYFEGVANRSGNPRGVASLVAERRAPSSGEQGTVTSPAARPLGGSAGTS